MDVGPTFAGMDFLVLMIAFALGWLWEQKGDRNFFRAGKGAYPLFVPALYAASAIFAVHLLYLILLSFAADLIEVLPVPPAPVLSFLPT